MRPTVELKLQTPNCQVHFLFQTDYPNIIIRFDLKASDILRTKTDRETTECLKEQNVGVHVLFCPQIFTLKFSCVRKVWKLFRLSESVNPFLRAIPAKKGHRNRYAVEQSSVVRRIENPFAGSRYNNPFPSAYKIHGAYVEPVIMPVSASGLLTASRRRAYFIFRTELESVWYFFHSGVIICSRSFLYITFFPISCL